jgi:hypothetical protein
MDKIKGADTAKAVWIDPRNGKTVSVGAYPTTESKSFATPEGWEDALLILEASGG